MSEPRIGVYPGTFDPITRGHVDIIQRAALHLVDRLIVAVAANPGKDPLFNQDERVQLVREEVESLDGGLGNRVEVVSFGSLLIHFVRDCGATMVVRGLRAASDFEYEFQMASMNARLDPEIETVFLAASGSYHFVASKLVKEIAQLGGDISGFVSPRVAQRVYANYGIDPKPAGGR
jgi:pantetheine-phosphate adenylyltransferase